MRVRLPPTQLIRISVLKTEYGEVAELADAICIVKTYHFRGTDSKTHTKEQIQCRFKSYPLHSRRWRKCPYKSRRCANYMSEVAQLVEHERKKWIMFVIRTAIFHSMLRTLSAVRVRPSLYMAMWCKGSTAALLRRMSC